MALEHKRLSIWKYPVDITDEFKLEIPSDNYFLTVQMQNDDACLWYQVDPNSKKETKNYRWIGTGHKFDCITGQLKYLGTVQVNWGLVFHLYEENKHIIRE